jgi:hypothetical protein
MVAMGELGGGRGRGRGEVIKISEFAASTAKEVEEALLLCDSATVLGDRGAGGGTREREGEGEGGGGSGSCEFVVIDLRGNRGGLLEGAVGLKDCVCCREKARARKRESERQEKEHARERESARVSERASEREREREGWVCGKIKGGERVGGVLAWVVF